MKVSTKKDTLKTTTPKCHINISQELSNEVGGYVFQFTLSAKEKADRLLEYVSKLKFADRNTR